MQKIQQALQSVLEALQKEGPNIVMSILLLPVIAWSAVFSGGMCSWLGIALGDGEHLVREGLPAYTRAAEDGLGTIHFLNTFSSDAILLESDGKFALVDASERGELGAYVLDYVKRISGGKLEFIMGTHDHSDHLGGFEALILDPEITIGKAYLKPSSWDGEGYNQAFAAACAARGIALAQNDLEHHEFTLGEMRLKIFNGTVNEAWSDNAGSMCLLVECGELRAFLAADLTWHHGREDSIAREIGGRLDLLKVGHHGYNGSNGAPYLALLRPKTAVYTNHYDNITNEVKTRFTLVSNTTQMATSDFGGIAAVFGSDGVLQYYAIGEHPAD